MAKAKRRKPKKEAAPPRPLRLEYIDPAQLNDNPANWRTHPAKQTAALQGALAEVGWAGALLYNERTKRLIDGHARKKMVAGKGEVPVLIGNWDEETEKKILVTLDPLSAIAETNSEALESLLREVHFDDEALTAMLADLAETTGISDGLDEQIVDAEPQIDRAAELNKKWQVKEGDLWHVGDHRLLCGDSTKREDVERVMCGEKANMVWTDPPYGVNYGAKLDRANPQGYRVRTIQNDDLSPDRLEGFIREVFRGAASATVPGASIYAACPAGTPLPALIASFAGSGFDFRWGLVWVKDQLVLGRGDYHFRHENILYGWKPDAAHYFVGERTHDSIFEIPRPKKSDEHPTMKPVALVAAMVHNSSRKADTVYDPFLGSGTTIIACENLNRKCRGIEISPEYCAVILERMQTAFPSIKIERIG